MSITSFFKMFARKKAKKMVIREPHVKTWYRGYNLRYIEKSWTRGDNLRSLSN